MFYIKTYNKISPKGLSEFPADFYQVSELEQIIRRSASILEVNTDAGGTAEIARRSRGTPRIANRLLRRVRDFAQVKNEPIVSREVAHAALTLVEVDDGSPPVPMLYAGPPLFQEEQAVTAQPLGLAHDGGVGDAELVGDLAEGRAA